MADELLTDLSLNGDDLAETSTGDLAVVSGAPNLAQAVLRRLIRAPGELVWAPGYGAGLTRFIEQANTPATRLVAAQLGRRSLRQDPRVDEVDVSVTAGASPNETQVLVEGISSTGEPFAGVKMLEF